MNAIAIEVSPAVSGQPRSVAPRSSDPIAPLTVQLVRYWRERLVHPLSTRSEDLDVAAKSVRAGKTPAASLVPFALADNDDEIVFRAVLAYLAASQGQRLPYLAAAANAVEWIRRRLALNRAAVFAALLSTGDPEVLELLLPLRQCLDAGELAVILRRHRLHPLRPSAAGEFLQAWMDLLTIDGLQFEPR